MSGDEAFHFPFRVSQNLHRGDYELHAHRVVARGHAFPDHALGAIAFGVQRKHELGKITAFEGRVRCD